MFSVFMWPLDVIEQVNKSTFAPFPFCLTRAQLPRPNARLQSSPHKDLSHAAASSGSVRVTGCSFASERIASWPDALLSARGRVMIIQRFCAPSVIVSTATLLIYQDRVPSPPRPLIFSTSSNFPFRILPKPSVPFFLLPPLFLCLFPGFSFPKRKAFALNTADLRRWLGDLFY